MTRTSQPLNPPYKYRNWNQTYATKHEPTSQPIPLTRFGKDLTKINAPNGQLPTTPNLRGYPMANP